MRRAIVAIVVLVAATGAAASPAAAHGGPGGSEPPATNYRSRITDITPRVTGIDIRVIEAGARLELVNDTGQDATILGYQGEPYLRIGPDGAFENIHSPATYLNQDRYAETALPPEADPDAEPVWRRIGGASTARWHDHRAHWMGGEDPPAVARDRSAEHVIVPSWEVPVVLADDTEIAVTGDLTWVPGSSPIPWILAAAALFVLTVVAGRIRIRPVAAGALLLLVAAVAADTVGLWAATGEPWLTKSTALVAPLACAGIGVVAWSQLRRNADDALILVAAAGAGFTLLFGVFNLDWLARSQLPTSLEPGLARGAVVTALGAGSALVVLGLGPLTQRVLALRPRPNVAPRSAPPPNRTTAAADGGALGGYRKRILLAAAAILVAGGIAAALTESDNGPSANATGGAPGAHNQLCLAARLATEGDRAGAEEVFYADVHRPLHELARATASEDRRLAAQLLRDKQAVEAARITDPEALPDALDQLVLTAQDALEVTTGDRPPDCRLQEET